MNVERLMGYMKKDADGQLVYYLGEPSANGEQFITVASLYRMFTVSADPKMVSRIEEVTKGNAIQKTTVEWVAKAKRPDTTWISPRSFLDGLKNFRRVYKQETGKYPPRVLYRTGNVWLDCKLLKQLCECVPSEEYLTVYTADKKTLVHISGEFGDYYICPVNCNPETSGSWTAR